LIDLTKTILVSMVLFVGFWGLNIGRSQQQPSEGFIFHITDDFIKTHRGRKAPIHIQGIALKSYRTYEIVIEIPGGLQILFLFSKTAEVI